MVRLEIKKKEKGRLENENLHSSMVRLEINSSEIKVSKKNIFTFQYG